MMYRKGTIDLIRIKSKRRNKLRRTFFIPLSFIIIVRLKLGKYITMSLFYSSYRVVNSENVC